MGLSIMQLGVILLMQGVSAHDMSTATAQLTSYCVERAAETPDAAAACACGVGIAAERLSDHEYVAMAAVSPYVDDANDMTTATKTLEKDGYSARLMESAAGKLRRAAPRINRVCSVLTKPKDQWRLASEHLGSNTVLRQVRLLPSNSYSAEPFSALGQAAGSAASRLRTE